MAKKRIQIRVTRCLGGRPHRQISHKYYTTILNGSSKFRADETSIWQSNIYSNFKWLHIRYQLVTASSTNTHPDH